MIWLVVMLAATIGYYCIGVNIETRLATVFLIATTLAATNIKKIKNWIDRIKKEPYCI